jgi:hypothetical protein
MFADCSELHGLIGLMEESLHNKERLPIVQMVILNVEIFFNNFKFPNFPAYANCVNEPYCAARAIQGYMKRFGQGKKDFICLIFHKKIIISS